MVLTIFLPELFLLINCIILMLYLSNNNAQSTIIISSINASIITLLLKIYTYLKLDITNLPIITDLFTIEKSYFAIQIILSILVCIIIISNTLNGPKANFNTLFLLLSLFLNISLITHNFITLILSLEGIAYCLYFLIYLTNSKTSIESLVKYFFYNAIFSILLITGAVLSYMLIPHATFNFIYFSNNINLSTETLNSATNLLIVTGLFLFISFMGKLGITPFSFWMPDIYSTFSYKLLLIILGLIKPILFIIFIKILFIITYIIPQPNYFLQIFIGLVAILSIIVGTFGCLTEQRIKKILIYTSIQNIGILILPIFCIAINQNYLITNYSSISIILFYLLIYTLTLICFLTLLSIFDAYEPLIYVSDLYGLYYKHKLLSLALIIIIASLAGLPPFAGFFIKWQLCIFIITITKSLSLPLLILIFISNILITVVYSLFIIKICVNISKTKNKLIIKKSINNNYINLYKLILVLFVSCIIIGTIIYSIDWLLSLHLINFLMQFSILPTPILY